MADPEDAPTADDAPEEDVDRGRLPSFDDVNLSVGQFMAGLEQKILHNRPPAVVVVQEEGRGEQVQTNGLVTATCLSSRWTGPNRPTTRASRSGRSTPARRRRGAR